MEDTPLANGVLLQPVRLECLLRLNFLRRSSHGAQKGKLLSITFLPFKMVKALMIGVGGVGEAIARMAAEREWVELMVLAGEALCTAYDVNFCFCCCYWVLYLFA